MRPLTHLFVAESAIYGWWESLPNNEMWGLIDFMGDRDVTSVLLLSSSVDSNVPRISVDNAILRTILEEIGGMWIVRLDQKSVALISMLCRNSQNAGALGPEVLAGTLYTAKACLLLEKHWRIVWCEKDSPFAQKRMGVLVEVYACKLPNNKYDLESGVELM